MNCADVKELLSAYYDAELSSDARTKVAEHLGECSQCAQERSGFEKLSGMVQCLDAPVPPSLTWQQFQDRLDRAPTIEAADRFKRADLMPRPRWIRYRVLRPVLAIAALVLIAVGWMAYENWLAPADHSLLAADMGQYVDEFQRDPDAAQQMLVAKYAGQEIELAEAVQRVGYPPAVAGEMPPAYTLDSVFVLKMPCCNCLQTVCRRSDGSKLAIFEYGDEQPVSFGDRPENTVQCQGMNCRLVEVNEQFAASWKQGGRHISVVGVRDQAEFENLVAWLD